MNDLPIERFPYHVDVNNLFRFVFRIFVEVDEGEMSVIDGGHPIRPSRNVFGEKKLVGKSHRGTTGRKNC